MNFKFCSWLLVFGAACAMFGTAHATTFPKPFSQYGQIQNVQNYSSNPTWNPDSPYNQRVVPTPVYVQGPDLTAADCQRVVSVYVAAECATKNNCRGMQLSDIRPAIMTRLSQLTDHNYSVACAGYLDTEFDKYIQNNAGTGGYAAFPGATTPNPNATATEYKLENPYKPKLPEWNGKSWSEEIKERKQELKDLQAINGAGNEKVVRADFPTTYADLSFSERMANTAAGLEPYKDKSAYQQIQIEDKETYMARRQQLAEAQQKLDKMKMSPAEYCKTYPGDAACQPTNGSDNTGNTGGNTGNNDNNTSGNNNNNTNLREELIQKIIGALPK